MSILTTNSKYKGLNLCLMSHVVFISHDANRTGAPIVLLHLLRWLKKRNEFSFSIVLLFGGELEVEFQALAPTYIWRTFNPFAVSSPLVTRRRYWSRMVDFVQSSAVVQRANEQRIIASLIKEDVKLIYANTVVASEIAVQLKKALNCPAVCHVHELSMAIDGYFGATRFGKLVPDIDLFIAASGAVETNLLSSYPITEDKIVKVYEFINNPAAQIIDQSVAMSIRASLGIPDNAFVVAASGTFEWRKSPVLFVQLAEYMRRNMDVMPYFLWIGGNLNSLAWQELQFDIERLELKEYVKFIGPQPNLFNYLQSADVFVLTSREDPYPLVCLEAAALAKPVLCFEQSGGMPEFVETDCGCVIPFLQIDLMGVAIQNLLLNSVKREELGSNARIKVQARHSVDIAGQQIVDLIKKLIGKC